MNPKTILELPSGLPRRLGPLPLSAADAPVCLAASSLRAAEALCGVLPRARRPVAWRPAVDPLPAAWNGPEGAGRRQPAPREEMAAWAAAARAANVLRVSAVSSRPGHPELPRGAAGLAVDLSGWLGRLLAYEAEGKASPDRLRRARALGLAVNFFAWKPGEVPLVVVLRDGDAALSLAEDALASQQTWDAAWAALGGARVLTMRGRWAFFSDSKTTREEYRRHLARIRAEVPEEEEGVEVPAAAAAQAPEGPRRGPGRRAAPWAPLDAGQRAALLEGQRTALQAVSVIAADPARWADVARAAPEGRVSKATPNLVNESVGKSLMAGLDDSYVQSGLLEADIAAAASAFSGDPRYPMFLKNLTRTPASDETQYAENWTFVFADSAGNEHKVSLDVPILLDNRFLFLNGGKKQMRKQLLSRPIVKFAPDTVRVSTNTNKIYVERFGGGTAVVLGALRKWMTETAPPAGWAWRLGSASTRVAPGSPLELSEAAGWLLSLSGPGGLEVRTDAAEAAALVAGMQYHENDIALGRLGRVPLTMSRDDGSVRAGGETWASLSALLEARLSADVGLPSLVDAARTSGHARASIAGAKVPVAALLAWSAGGLEKTAAAQAARSLAYDSGEGSLPGGTRSVRMAGGRVYWTPSAETAETSLFLNGLLQLDLEDVPMEEALTSGAPWAAVVGDSAGSLSKAKSVDNIMATLIDPITRQVLESEGLPTEVEGVLTYCLFLLRDNRHIKENDMTGYRVRGAEMISAFVLAELVEAYRAYRDGARSGSLVKMNRPKQAVLKAMGESQVVSEYAVLNPVLEIEELSSLSAKGPGGVNLDDAYGLEMRSFGKTMVGLLALNTPDSAKVGVVRHLTSDPRVVSLRGTIGETPGTPPGPAGLLAQAELLSPLTANRADPPRVGMAVTQFKHLVPAADGQVPLLQTGAEKALAHQLSTDFVHVAKKSGRVTSIDEKTGIMVLTYEDGLRDVVDIAATPAFNAEGGFYIANKKTPRYTAGESFKAGDVIAANNQYFQDDEDGDVCFAPGVLAKVALAGGDFTLEDSSLITRSLSGRMTTTLVMSKKVDLDPLSNLDSYKWVGDLVKTGDVLAAFDSGYEDPAVAAMLGRMSAELGQAVAKGSRTTIKSKYSGRVVDVKVLWAVDEEQMSQSLRALVQRYKKARSARERAAASGSGPSPVLPSPLRPLPPGSRAAGGRLEGVALEFFIEVQVPLGVGGKLTFETALKTIAAEVVPAGQEPRSELAPGEEVSAVLGPLSAAGRMTTDLWMKLALNKGLVELKRAFGEALDLEVANPSAGG